MVPDEVLVGLPTESRLTEVGDYVESLDWPAAIGPVTAENVDLVFSIPQGSTPQGEDRFLTVVQLYLQTPIDVPDAVAALDGFGTVEYAEPNWYLPGGGAQGVGQGEPNDPQFALPAGDPDRYHHDLIETPAAWESLPSGEWGGEGIVVAVVDSGMDYAHEDLYQNIWINQGEIPAVVLATLTELPNDNDDVITFYDLNDALNFPSTYVADHNNNGYIDGHDLLYLDAAGLVQNTDWINNDDADTNGYTDDLIGWDFRSALRDPGDEDNDPFSEGEAHATNMAGIIAARAHNGTGLAGVAGRATIMPLRVIGPDDGVDTSPDFAGRCRAFVYATQNGAHIVSSSLAVPYSANWDPITYRESVDYMYANGVLHDNSAGNWSRFNFKNLNYHQTLFVANTDPSDMKYSYGAEDDRGSDYGTGIDISAPGVSIYTTTLWDDAYDYSGGTSSATAVISGTAALIWSQHPEWTRDQVAAQLLGTTDNIDLKNAYFGVPFDSPPEEQVSKPLQGMLGTGRVNASRAVNETLLPPRIEGIREIPYEAATNMTQFTVDLANVFQGPTFDALGTMLTTSPIDVAANWELWDDGFDNELGTGDDQPIALTLQYTTSEPGTTIGDYSNYAGYKIGTNDVTFTFAALAGGRYRFKALADGPTTNDLRDPFGALLDGNGDGEGGDDYVRDFYVGTPSSTLVIDASAPGSTIVLSASTQPHGALEVTIDGEPLSPAPPLLMELTFITINGSASDDTITVDFLSYDLGANTNSVPVIINGEGGNDSVTVYGGPGEDEFYADTSGVGLVVYTIPSTLNPDQVRTYAILTVSIFDVTAFGGEGTDAAELIGGTDTDDTLVNQQGAGLTDNLRFYDALNGDYDFQIDQFEEVSAASDFGSADVATLYGSDGDDVFRGYHFDFPDDPSYAFESATLSAGELFLSIDGFPTVTVDTGGGRGTAHLYANRETETVNPHTQETFEASPINRATLTSSDGWSNEVSGFDMVYVHDLEAEDTQTLHPPLHPSIHVLPADRSNSELATFFWDEQGDGDWKVTSSTSDRWLDMHGEPLTGFPDGANAYAVVEKDTVDNTYDQTLFGLEALNGATVNFFGLTVDQLELDVDGTVNVQSYVFGDFALQDNGQFICKIDDASNGLLTVENTVTLGAGTTLAVQVTDFLGDLSNQARQWGGYTEVIITGGVGSDTFGTVPKAQDDPAPDHLGHGVWLTNLYTLDDGHGDAVYDDPNNGDVHLDLFQAAPGDTDGNRKVEGWDIFTILQAGFFGDGVKPEVNWTNGDFNGDHKVSGEDTLAWLGTGLFGEGTYWTGTAAPASSPPAAPQGGGSAPMGMAQGGSAVELVLTPQGLMIDTHGVAINSYVIESQSGVFTGKRAKNLGMFREDTDQQISGGFDYVLTGKHVLGKVIGDEFAAVDLAADLTLRYTIEGQPGIYTATIGTASAEALAWLADYDAEDESTFSHGVDPAAADRLLATL